MRLAKKYQKIWYLAKPYLAICRWWDLTHTEMSIGFLYKIMKGENVEDLENVLVPSIILHDIGWSTIGKEKNVSWGSSEMRVKHMKAGAKISKDLLNKVKYDKHLIKKVVELVSTHDNAYLGIEQVTIEEKLIRDADACFVLTALSFWKDYYVTTVVKGVKITPQNFLNQQVKKNSKRHTKTAQDITDQQIIERATEIKDTSLTPAQRYKRLRSKADIKNKRTLTA